MFVGGCMSYPPTKKHVHSYKQDMYPPTNKTCTLLETKHVHSYKQDMYLPTNMTCTLRRVHVMFVGGYMPCL
jgi:hypothetical protein